MQLTILFLTSLTKQSGNFCTINRIRLFLSQQGHQCCYEDPKSFESRVAFQSYVTHHRVDIIIGIHAYRSGCLLRASTVPYILILGGTDVNEFYKDIKKLTVMTEAVVNARYVVVFGKSLSTRASILWPSLASDKVKEIKQAVITQPSRFCLLKYLKHHKHLPTSVTSLQDLTVFLYLGGIRPVKDPVYLIETFSDWHKEDCSVYYVIIGPKGEDRPRCVGCDEDLTVKHVLLDCVDFATQRAGFYSSPSLKHLFTQVPGHLIIDEHYFDQDFWPALKKSQGVIYIPGLPIQDAHAAMRDCFSVVNSSISEGMSLAVLEAMDLGVPVIARNVPGNRDIIHDGNTGLIYSNPEEFTRKARSLMLSPEKRNKIIATATNHVNKHHATEVEGQVYLSLVRSVCVLPKQPKTCLH